MHQGFNMSLGKQLNFYRMAIFIGLIEECTDKTTVTSSNSRELEHVVYRKGWREKEMKSKGSNAMQNER